MITINHLDSLALTTGMATYLTLICYDFIYCGWPIYPGGQGLFMYRSIFPGGRAMWSRSIYPDGLLCTYHGRPIFPGNQLYRSHYGWPIYPGGRDQMTLSIYRQDEVPLFYKFLILVYFIQDSMAPEKVTKPKKAKKAWMDNLETLITKQTTSISSLTEKLSTYMSQSNTSDPPPAKRPKPSEDSSQPNKSDPLRKQIAMTNLINAMVIFLDLT